MDTSSSESRHQKHKRFFFLPTEAFSVANFQFDIASNDDHCRSFLLCRANDEVECAVMKGFKSIGQILDSHSVNCKICK